MKPDLQEYYDDLRKNLSKRANHILNKGGFDNPQIVISKLYSLKKILAFRNCGLKTAQEIFALFCKLKEYAETIEGQTDIEVSNKENETDVTDSEISITNKDSESKQKEVDIVLFQDSYDRLLSTLSTRTYNIAEKLGLLSIKAFVPYLQSSEIDFLKIGKCGKKSASEFFWLASEVQKKITYYTDSFLTQDFASDTFARLLDENFSFSISEITFVNYFKNKHGYMPMAFLTYNLIGNTLSERGFRVFKLYYGIEKWELTSVNRNKILGVYKDPRAYVSPLDVMELLLGVSRERIRQITNNIRKRLVAVVPKWLRYHSDWSYYGVDNTQYFYVPDSKAVEKENNDLYGFMKKTLDPDEFKVFFENKPTIDGNNFIALLQCFEMTPYWLCDKTGILYTYPIKTCECFCISINKKFDYYKFNKALKEFERLCKIKHDADIIIPIENYFMDNTSYWKIQIDLSEKEKDALQQLLVELFNLCGTLNHIQFKGDKLCIPTNVFDFKETLYNILKSAKTRLHLDEMFRRLENICIERHIPLKMSESSRISKFLNADPRIVHYGNSGYWGLKEWGENTGSIREIAIQIVKKNKEPILISNLIKKIIDRRPDSKKNSISTVIFQAVGNGELVLFFDDYIGYPKRKYDGKYILMPKTFADWLHEFKKFVKKNRRFPFSNQKGYEGCLYRWFFKARQLTELSPEEVLKFDSVMKELSKFPQDATEYNFLQKCNIIKNFIEANKRMLTEEDDFKLFNWFYSTSKKYKSFHDNRHVYFSVLLEQISDILY